MAGEASYKPWIVVFVHGVGAGRAGEMLTAASAALNDASSNSLVFANKIRTDIEGGYSFDAYEGQFGGQPARWGEVYWGDISRAHRSNLQLFLAVLLACFRLPHLIHASLQLRSWSARPVGWLIEAMATILRVVVLPLTVLAACIGLFGALLTAFGMSPDRMEPTRALAFVALASAVTSLGFLLLWRRLRRATSGWEVLSPSAAAICIFGLISIGVAVSDGWIVPGWVKTELCPEGRCYNAAKKCPGNFCPDWSRDSSPHSTYGLQLALNIKAQDISLSIALIALSLAMALTALTPRRNSDARTSMRIAVAAAATLFVCYFLLTKPIDILTAFTLSSAKSLYLYWYDVFIAAFVVAATYQIFKTLRDRIRWSRRAGTTPASIDDAVPPRLIVPEAYISMTFALVWSTTAMALAVEVSKLGNQEPFVPPIPIPSVYLWILAAGLAAAALRYSETLNFALRVVLDIVDHFYVPPRGAPVAERRRDRLLGVVKALGGSKDVNLAIIAHSQGTMVALDALHSGALSQLGSSIKLLTVGSPHQHIYRHYFSHLLPPTIPVDGVEWVNAFRCDDFVGRKIEHPAALNIPLPVGGHTAYWEGSVFSAIKSEKGSFLPI